MVQAAFPVSDPGFSPPNRDPQPAERHGQQGKGAGLGDVRAFLMQVDVREMAGQILRQDVPAELLGLHLQGQDAVRPVKQDAVPVEGLVREDVG